MHIHPAGPLGRLPSHSSARPAPAALLQPQPLSQAVLQLEAVVTDPRLPPDVLAANTAAFGKLRAFLDGLTGLRTYPKAEIQNLQFALR